MKETFERIRRRSWEICDRYYGSDYIHHNDRYRTEVLKYLGPKTILLDAGAGELGFTKEFAPKVRLAVGTDMGELKPVGGGVWAVRSNLEHLPFKEGVFDVVVSMSVVEHLTDPISSFRRYGASSNHAWQHRLLEVGWPPLTRSGWSNWRVSTWSPLAMLTPRMPHATRRRPSGIP